MVIQISTYKIDTDFRQKIAEIQLQVIFVVAIVTKKRMTAADSEHIEK